MYMSMHHLCFLIIHIYVIPLGCNNMSLCEVVRKIAKVQAVRDLYTVYPVACKDASCVACSIVLKSCFETTNKKT